jgi:hypothetical protein
MMKVLYLPMPDRGLSTPHQAPCRSLSQMRVLVAEFGAAMPSFRPYVMDMDRGMAAARRIERLALMPATKADRLQGLLIRIFGRSVRKLYRRQKPSQQQQFGDMADLSPHAFGPAERGVANVTFDVVARVAACLATISAKLLNDDQQICLPILLP